MKRLSFPVIGSIRTLPLVKPPERRDDESDDDFAERKRGYEPYAELELDVEVIPRADFAEMTMGLASAYADDQKRQHDTEISSFGLTLEGFREVAEIQRALVRRCVAAVRGLNVGDRRSDDVTDRAELAALVEGCDLLGSAAERAKEAQALNPVQVER